MRHITVLLIIALASTSVAAQSPSRIDLRRALTEGQWVVRPVGESRQISGTVLPTDHAAQAHKPLPKWLVPTLIAVGAVTTMAIVTHGVIPGCLFQLQQCLN